MNIEKKLKREVRSISVLDMVGKYIADGRDVTHDRSSYWYKRCIILL